MKSDRKITLDELLSDNYSKDYLDKKEKKAIIKRHIGRLAEKRFDLEDKIKIVGEDKKLKKQYEILNCKIEKLNCQISSKVKKKRGK